MGSSAGSAGGGVSGAIIVSSGPSSDICRPVEEGFVVVCDFI